MPLSQKNALLFGAGVIASGYANGFVKEGATIAIVSRGESRERLKESVLNATGADASQIITLRGDASNVEDLKRVYGDAAKRMPSIDIVINGSGGNRPEAVASSLDAFINMPFETAGGIMASNYLSKRYSMQLYAGYLKNAGRRGSVVNITSMSGFQPMSKVMDYSAAYAAVESLTQSLAFLYGRCNLGRINNVAVGFTIGEQNRRLLMNEDGTLTPRAQEILMNTSQSRFLDADEIAGHVMHLADDERCASVNGQTLKVDGGYNLIGLPQTSGY